MKSFNVFLLYPIDNVAYLSSPGYDFEERNQDWDSDERLRDPLLDERWSSDTLKVLSSMPSRTIGGFNKTSESAMTWSFIVIILTLLLRSTFMTWVH